MNKIVTDPLYLKCKRMVETCNKNQTEMAKNYLKLSIKKFNKKEISNIEKWIDYICIVINCFNPLYKKLEKLNG